MNQLSLSCKSLLIGFCFFIAIPLHLTAQNLAPGQDTTIIELTNDIYQNSAAGEFTPGKGFQLVKNKYASLNISIYGMVRYLNQFPGNQVWEDHLGNQRELVGRNDFQWHRSMIWFSGYLGTPKLTYMATVWTVMTTQQTLLYGNIQYAFNKHLRVGMGIYPNLHLRSLQGPFPFFSSTDRTMAEDAIRGGFTNGFFVYGELFPKLHYNMMLGNNLSTLGIKAAQLTRHLSRSISLTWMPTTGEFGPRGGQGDLEHHEKLATRFGVHYGFSRENRFNNTGVPSPDNTQVRMSDGVLFFETGALAPDVTVDEANFEIFTVDLGIKYKGLSVFTEFYHRVLFDYNADGEIPLESQSLLDKGFSIQAHYMIVPKLVSLYGIHSGLRDEFKRNPYEVGGGVNIYPYRSRSWRINVQGLYVYKTAAGGTFGLYTAGQTGGVFTLGTDILL